MQIKYIVFSLIVIAVGCSKQDNSEMATEPITLTVTTNPSSNITPQSFQAGGTISGGNLTIIARGICYSTTSLSPTINDNRTVDGSGPGTFTSTLSNLTPNTIYVFRAYATTADGTTYGKSADCTTPHQMTVPALDLHPIISPFSYQATLWSDVIDSGHASITAKGFCWSTSPNPTIANTTLPLGSGYGFGYFQGTTYSLTVNTTYYFRAYATNSQGTGYSNEIELRTEYHIGEGLGGGRIFYIDNTGMHGLIVGLNDLSMGIKWNNTTVPFSFVNAISSSNGSQNTTNIIAATGSYNNAAGICRSYTGGGYTDWYLPALDELWQLFLQRATIGNFVAAPYWTSTASSTSNSYAYTIAMGGGGTGAALKTELWLVRPIRAF